MMLPICFPIYLVYFSLVLCFSSMGLLFVSTELRFSVKLNRELRPLGESIEKIHTYFQDKTMDLSKGHFTFCVLPSGHKALLCWARRLCCVVTNPLRSPVRLASFSLSSWSGSDDPQCECEACSQKPWSCSTCVQHLTNSADEGPLCCI